MDCFFSLQNLFADAAKLRSQVYVETASLHPSDIEDVMERHPFLKSRLERYAQPWPFNSASFACFSTFLSTNCT